MSFPLVELLQLQYQRTAMPITHYLESGIVLQNFEYRLIVSGAETVEMLRAEIKFIVTNSKSGWLVGRNWI